MNYELAKELKEAGFPQKLIVNPPNNESTHATEQQASRSSHPTIPTLSELIEACVHNTRHFNLSYKVGVGWKARSYLANAIDSARCTTPEEAVAHLWLTLNKK